MQKFKSKFFKIKIRRRNKMELIVYDVGQSTIDEISVNRNTKNK